MYFSALVCAATFISACTGFEVKRLAPPGIIRYEKIAEEKEPNPTIEEEIAAVRSETKAQFPKVGETNASGNRLKKAPQPEAGMLEALVGAREALSVAVETDRAAAADLEEAAARLAAEREALAEGIEEAKSAARRETRPSPPDE
ncbi:MAG: hypothetical protein AAGD92_05955 [Pseudomonadota bacterium]